MAQEHRPVSFGRNRHPAHPQAVEYFTRATVPLALHPGRRRPGGASNPPGASRCRPPDRPGIPRPAAAQRHGPARVEQLHADLEQQQAAAHQRVQLQRPGEQVVDRRSRPPPRSRPGQPSDSSCAESIQPTSSPHEACRPSVVTSSAGQQVIRYQRLAAASSAWWLIVLSIGDGRKSSPAGREDGQLQTVSAPSSATVLRVQVAPASSSGPPGRAALGAAAGPPGPVARAQQRVQRRGGRRGLRRRRSPPVRRDPSAPIITCHPGLEFAGQVSQASPRRGR